MGEMTVRRQELPIPPEVAEELRGMREALQAMAGLLRVTNETMAQLNRQVRLLEKATPAQAAAVNRAIRERAAEISAVYMISEERAGKLVAAAIRRSVKAQFGAGTMTQLPRCDVPVALEMVQGWDDYGTMMGIREAVRA